jgi:nitrite reductase/ring-hydroxylating ferredoxin subunit
MAEFAPVLPLAALPLGTMSACTVGTRELVICHTPAGLFALDNICTHAEARLCEGRLRSMRLVCPLHGAAFDVRDGRVLAPPATCPLQTYPLRVLGGVIEVALTELG